MLADEVLAPATGVTVVTAEEEHDASHFWLAESAERSFTQASLYDGQRESLAELKSTQDPLPEKLQTKVLELLS